MLPVFCFLVYVNIRYFGQKSYKQESPLSVSPNMIEVKYI